MYLPTILIICFLTALFLTGCDSESSSGDGIAGSGSETDDNKKRDDYDEYIRSAIESVNREQNGEDETAGHSPVSLSPDVSVSSIDTPDDHTDVFATPSPSDGNGLPTPTATSPTPTDSPDDDEESPAPTVTGEGDEESPVSTEEEDATPTPTPTPYITPDEFDVGKCCVYINGESDSAYGTEIITAINKAREDLGYTPLVTNKGLGTCADRRTREVAASFGHTRPNGQMFYSLAPEHYKAEMLINGVQKAEDAVDTMIKRDPISRRLIFTEKYQSIGASSFKCNGTQYTVVSFGL